MEIYIDRIDPAATAQGVKRAIAHALQRSSFTQESFLQFTVTLDSVSSAGQYRRGLLILPTHDVGRRFLRDFGGTGPRYAVIIERTALVFFHNHHRLRDAPSTPQDNHRLGISHTSTEDQHLTESIWACQLPVISVQFAWECRDGVLSVEWESYFVPPKKQCRLSYNPLRHEFTIRMPEQDNTLIIVIHTNQLSWASSTHISKEKSALFLSLRSPPSYESEANHTISHVEHKPPLRRRLQFLDDEHAQCVPWTSLAIRLECEGMQVPAIQWLLSYAGVRLRDFTYPVEYRGLFSRRVQNRYNVWVKSLPWEVAIQVESITRDRLTDLKEMYSLQSDILGMSKKEGSAFTAAFLQQFADELKKAAEYRTDAPGGVDHVREVYLRSRNKFQYVAVPPEVDERMDSFLCVHVMVSPTTQRLRGPSSERTNRIIRKYWDNRDKFIIVSFVDDAQLPVQYRFDPQVDTLRFIRERYGEVLTKGVNVAGRHFDYLHYSLSGLREHKFWFIEPFETVTASDQSQVVTADTILNEIGDITEDSELIHFPALLGARLAQAFTSTDAAITVEAEEILSIPDIETVDSRGKIWCATDGVGTISQVLMQEIWDELLRSGYYKRLRSLGCPGGLQFRLAGAKGVLTVDYQLTGRAICLRPSQTKFSAPRSLQIEVVAVFYKPGRFALNRSLIMLFEGLGIRGGYKFLKSLQDDVVNTTVAAETSLQETRKLVDSYVLGESYHLSSFLRGLCLLGIDASQLNPFYQGMIQVLVHHVLRELKYHARIPAPGYTLPGVADVHKWLPEGHVFAYIVPIDGSEPLFLKGPVLVFRSPTKHPGDLQMATAIGKPPVGSPFEHEPLRNTLVFSVLGDPYVVTDFDKLHIARKSGPYPPAAYDPSARRRIERPSTKEDMIDFVVEFLYSNNIGIISNEWLLQADKKNGIFGRECLRLAKLHSDAVDYQKTGIPVRMHAIPKRKGQMRPDWSKPELSFEDARKYYRSTSWVGKLFQAIELPKLPALSQGSTGATDNLEPEDLLKAVRRRLASPADSFEELIQQHVSHFIDIKQLDNSHFEAIRKVYEDYKIQLSLIRYGYALTPGRSNNSPPATPLSEQEIMLGTISALCAQGQNHLRKTLVSGLREQAGHLCHNVREGLSVPLHVPQDQNASGEDLLRKSKNSLGRAWTAYGLSLVDKGKSVGADSFGCIVLGEIFDTIERMKGLAALSQN
ncbi:hypothetical protein EIP86_004319 [Pleurotus ostreatoroseus]|nr:hypothetical protein EIP86_004319 [Pleurotus ostreatoroseus]